VADTGAVESSTSSGFRIRTATADGDDALRRLDVTAWPEELPVVPPDPATSFFGPHRQPEDVLVCVGEGGDLAGYPHLAPHIPIETNTHLINLNALVVGADFRGRGLSHQLIDGAVEEARSRSRRKLGLRAMSTNSTGVRLYKSHGSALEGRLREEFRQPDGSYADDPWVAPALEGAAR
jgi:ribosomal protein S18 acetylase RimI-like enzyme